GQRRGGAPARAAYSAGAAAAGLPGTGRRPATGAWRGRRLRTGILPAAAVCQRSRPAAGRRRRTTELYRRSGAGQRSNPVRRGGAGAETAAAGVRTFHGRTPMNAEFRRQVLRNPVHFLAFGCGSGLAPKAPGTFGTLAAIPLYLLLN